MPKVYIEREAANKWICEICDGCEGTFCAPCDGNPLKDIPAADVVPVVKARWKEDVMMFTDKDGASRGGTYGFKCSACGGFYVGKSNFCPNCGADMREGTP